MIFLTPGPSSLHPQTAFIIRSALQQNLLSISHRGDKFHHIYAQTEDNLRSLLKVPSSYHIFFIASATEAMERITQNTVQKQSEHFVLGAFSARFAQIAQELGKKTVIHRIKPGNGLNPNNISPQSASESIMFTQTETSTGVSLLENDIQEYKKSNPKKIVCVDIVSSVPNVNLKLKYTDCVFFSVQKGLGLPSGLGVMIISPQALEKAEFLEKKKIVTGTFHSFHSLAKYAQKKETPETPNVLGIYLLGKICNQLQQEGLASIRKKTQLKASLLIDFAGKSSFLKPFVTDPKYRAPTVIVLKSSIDTSDLITTLKKKNITVGTGYKNYKREHLRIANFPQHTLENYHYLLQELSNIENSQT